ncbi:thioredoxin domain-containing protein [Streptomyces sp. NEAU-H3]|uniref:DsbA family protein n=1 Tax=Streptomyces sp. NEAU-H3 TaxID=2720636 RepID=UPI00143926DB|nr:thioredoxin domain-containing protein [Streptomyces sp. NEAU-H3]NJA55123.1 thioredoxin domain-containing protein [Streptomyces sp. NEAU-H3]
MSGAAACGDAAEAGKDEPGARPAAGPLTETLDADGTTIHVGRKLAAGTMHVYEDPRCPVCKEFEDSGGARVLPKRAVNALRAALEEGHFAAYHDVPYAHQPEESVDGFTTERLLALASKVDGLRGPAFDKAVRAMRYADFVAASEAAYERDGIQGTPSFFLDDTLIASGTNDMVTTETGMTLTLVTRGQEQLKQS